jgi:hypothetical protein
MKEQIFKVGDEVTYKSHDECGGNYYYGGYNLDGYVGKILSYIKYCEDKECWKVLASNDDGSYYMLESEFVEYDKKPKYYTVICKSEFEIREILRLLNEKGFEEESISYHENYISKYKVGHEFECYVNFENGWGFGDNDVYPKYINKISFSEFMSKQGKQPIYKQKTNSNERKIKVQRKNSEVRRGEKPTGHAVACGRSAKTIGGRYKGNVPNL